MPDQPGDTVLSDLCSICHITPPKYRCPRCQTRTCSLHCIRRHKSWSQCSGIRDPGAYLRRSELATESAFDRDYNFITGVERKLERAERDAENRGIRIGCDSSNSYVGDRKRKRDLNADASEPGEIRRLEKGEAALINRAADAGVTVIKAPVGISRQKENSSRWFPKQKCLSWSVEWIFPGKGRTVKNSLETSTLADAYDRLSIPSGEEARCMSQCQEPAQTVLESRQKDSVAETQEQQLVPPHLPALVQSATGEPISSYRGVYFYLLRPRTSTRQPVLIPLLRSMTFTNALHGRTVLEFPTVYVLRDSPAELHTEEGQVYLLEEEYLPTIEPNKEQSKLPDTGVESADTSVAGHLDLHDVDEQKVLEVLKQDLHEVDQTAR